MTQRPAYHAGRVLLLAAWLVFPPARAEIQFDAFLGYDERVREAHWFPAAFEILNDGPAFTGTVVLAPEDALETQLRIFEIELPTGTRKRAVIPVFPSGGGMVRWDARLLDASGKMVAERSGLQARHVTARAPILGALPRTFGGLPVLPELKDRATEFLPNVARLQPDYLPENPIALEGLTACYVNSERASDLKPAQVDALLTWLHGGGHLIVGIEQPTDVNGLPWLRALVPFAPQAVSNRPVEGSFERWLVSGRESIQLPSVLRPRGRVRPTGQPGQVRIQAPPDVAARDPYARIIPEDAFNNAELPVVTGALAPGARAEVVLGLGGTPLVISAAKGRGKVTVLAFSPEREPFRSWKNRGWFWAKLISVPPELLVESDLLRWGGSSIDGLFGAMLDSRQVRKLPVGALLLLLVVYLAVIGPFDQWILKRTGRQMWTWITFPAYVVLFSGLIYFIGYRLRAGDLEWNELQVVDQLPRNNEATLRGRTWISLYSPVNARYRTASSQPFATFRAEHQQGAPGRGDSGRLSVRYPAHGFDATAFVPVWVSQLYASDWIQPGAVLISGTISPEADGVRVVAENRSSMRFEEMRLACFGRIHELGALEPGQRVEQRLSLEGGRSLEDLASSLPMALRAAQQRRHAFGGGGSGQYDRGLDGVVLASLADHLSDTRLDPGQGFVAPAGFDMGQTIQGGHAILFAWASRQGVAEPIHRFSPRRLQRDTVVRVVLPADSSP
jgi:hypothetical protein